MPRTTDELENAILNAEAPVRAALLLAITEVLDGVVQVYGALGHADWFARYCEARDSLWNDLANGMPLSAHAESTLALFDAVEAQVNLTEDEVLQRYGNVASEMSAALYHAASSASPFETNNAAFTAFACLQSLYYPEKKIWTPYELDAFRSHVSYFILQQAADVLLSRIVLTNEGLKAARDDARAIGNALNAVLPKPPTETRRN